MAGQATDASPGASLLPSNADLRVTSSVVAINVARTAVEQGLSTVDLATITETVRTTAWWPMYCPVEAI